MRAMLKAVYHRLGLHALWRRYEQHRHVRARLRQWVRDGRPVPPPHVQKQKVLRHYARKYRLGTLVETGTYLGDMMEAMKPDFSRLISIELSPMLHEKARQRFADDPRIELLQGDSGPTMAAIMPRLKNPALFWLDGHYSGDITAQGPVDTPVLEELTHIFSAPDLGHVVLIDDARCFGKEPGYPTIQEISEFVRSRRPHVNITTEDDIIRITPR